MSERTIALKLVLDHLGLGHDISTVEQRLAIQKAVYMVQTAGVPLGYNYGWYLKGPYSPALTKSYYGLRDDDISLEESKGFTIREGVRNTLDQLKDLFSALPAGLPQAQWLELLASLHYLIKASRYSHDQAKTKIGETKPHLGPYVDNGLGALAAHQMI